MASETKKMGRSGSAGGRGKAREAGSAQAGVGHALRSTWQQTVAEDVPADMLDLLGKLR